MANLNKPGSGIDLISKVLRDNNPNLKQYLMQPSSEIAKLQKNINTPKSVKSQNN
jgi:hypothetical protein